MKTYDVLVLGGGTAGTVAAKAASQAGAEVAMFNDGELGGLCILRGCMPTKTLLHAAHLAHHARHSITPGVSASGVETDFAAIMANKDEKVARFKQAKVEGIEVGGYDVIDARARFIGPDAVEAGGAEYRFRRGAVIATGSVPTLPPVPGLDGVPYLTSDDVMELRERPESLVVLGVGAIGLELAQFFARVGTRVHVVARRGVLASANERIAGEMRAALRAELGLELHEGSAPARVARRDGGIVLELEDGSKIKAEKLLVATGRRAAVEGLGLDAAGIDLNGRRFAHGADMRTTNPNVYVAGDASGDRLLLHVANWEGRVAGLNAAAQGEQRSEQVEQRLHMEAIFTDPPFARIGQTTEEARASGAEVLEAYQPIAETGRAITMDVQHGGFLLVADASTGELLGAQVLGPRADDIVHVVSSIMYYRGTAADMLEMPWYHPTISEVLLGLAREIQAQVKV